MDRLDSMLSGHIHTQAEEQNVPVVVCLSHEDLFESLSCKHYFGKIEVLQPVA